MQAGLIKFETIIFNVYYENEEIIEKSVPQSAKISKLERIFSKFPSQLEFGGEHLFWGTAREVLFIYCYRRVRQSIRSQTTLSLFQLSNHKFFTDPIFGLQFV